MRRELRPGLCHGIVGSGRFEVPVSIEDLRDGTCELEHFLCVRRVAAIDEETSGVTLERDDVVSGARNQRRGVCQLRGGYTGLAESGPRQTQRRCAGSEGTEEFTSLRFHYADYCSAGAGKPVGIRRSACERNTIARWRWSVIRPVTQNWRRRGLLAAPLAGLILAVWIA